MMMAEEDAQPSLDKIKNRLATTSATCIMEGFLMKRSDTLRKWNQRYFTLDPATGKMEYRLQRGQGSPRGFIHFQPDSTITLYPVNFQGLKKYDGCCIYIGTPQKKEYFLCAETPTIARAWVATLRAAALVLKAHTEAVDSLGGNGHAKLGTVAAVVAAANATAREGMKEVHLSLKEAVKLSSKHMQVNSSSDDMADVVKETLRVKDEELTQISRDLRARDFTIKEMAVNLAETAAAAEAAASAAKAMDHELKSARSEIERLQEESAERLYNASREVRMAEEAVSGAFKARDDALQEAHRWRVELGKGREQIVVMEAALVRSEESARRAAADAEEKVRLAKASEVGALRAKEEAFHLAKQWQAQAEYYRDQACRYMAVVQARDACEQQREEKINAVENSDLSDGSASESEPSGMSDSEDMPTPDAVANPETFPRERASNTAETSVDVSGLLRGSSSPTDAEIDVAELNYNPIIPELLTGSSEGRSLCASAVSGEIGSPLPEEGVGRTELMEESSHSVGPKRQSSCESVEDVEICSTVPVPVGRVPSLDAPGQSDSESKSFSESTAAAEAVSNLKAVEKSISDSVVTTEGPILNPVELVTNAEVPGKLVSQFAATVEISCPAPISFEGVPKLLPSACDAIAGGNNAEDVSEEFSEAVEDFPEPEEGISKESQDRNNVLGEPVVETPVSVAQTRTKGAGDEKWSVDIESPDC